MARTVDRDYGKDFYAFIDSHVPASGYTAGYAAQVVRELDEQDPDLLAGWLHRQAVTLVYEALQRRATKARKAQWRGIEGSVFRQPPAGETPPVNVSELPLEDLVKDPAAMRALKPGFRDALLKAQADRQKLERSRGVPPAPDSPARPGSRDKA